MLFELHCLVLLRKQKVAKMLEMTSSCFICEVRLAEEAGAVICAYECTYCPECASGLDQAWTTRGGELVPGLKRLVVVSTGSLVRGKRTITEGCALSTLQIYVGGSSTTFDLSKTPTPSKVMAQTTNAIPINASAMLTPKAISGV
jgi:hypothetical protein